jgi:Type II secretory pathway, prepilin signal peptidase PulO and related peptidases
LIAWYDNFPVLSYLILRGRCRNCRKPISARYPGVELLTAGISILLYYKFGLTIEWGIYLVFSAALVTLAFIDMDRRILPFSITINGIWIGILVNVILEWPSTFASKWLEYAGLGGLSPKWVALVASLAGAVICGGFLWLVGAGVTRVMGVEAMGFGDVVMMAMVGAFLGAPLALLTIMMGSVLGAVIGVAFILISGKGKRYELPFGTFLGFAAIIAVLYGNPHRLVLGPYDSAGAMNALAEFSVAIALIAISIVLLRFRSDYKHRRLHDQITNEMPSGVVTVNRHGLIIGHNRASERIFEGMLTNAVLRELVSESERLQNLLDRCINAGEVFTRVEFHVPLAPNTRKESASISLRLQTKKEEWKERFACCPIYGDCGSAESNQAERKLRSPGRNVGRDCTRIQEFDCDCPWIRTAFLR